MCNQALIMKAKKGDQKALAKLLQENYHFVYKYTLKIACHHQVAEDITQDTMVKAIQKINQYYGDSKFSTWLISIATNLFLDFKRKEQRKSRYIEDPDTIRKIKWYLDQQLEQMDIHDELFKLDSDYRIPLLLKHYYGFKYNEIGKMLSMKPGTVKSRVHYALMTIRKELHHEI